MMLARFLLSLLAAGLLAACATSPMNRTQMVLYSEAEMARMGETTWRRMRREMTPTPHASESRYVECVANYVLAALDADQRAIRWEVAVFDSDQANAFALPGGKIGVFNGLLDVAWNQHQLAAVLAHEVGHVLARHGNERASQNALRNIGILTASVLGVPDATIEAANIGAELGLFLPFSRGQESEADTIGIMLMAGAGFDPEQSVSLWENMSREGGLRPPELLSSHPSPASRIEELKALMPPAAAVRRSANARGMNPDCVPGRTG